MNKFVVLLSVILTLNISLYGQGKWIQKANFPGVATHEGVGFTINGKGYIVGGTIKYPNWTNEVWEYNPSNDSWIKKSNAPIDGLREPVAFVIGNKAYIGTGMNGTSLINDFWEYDPAIDKWTVKTKFPEPQEGMQLVLQ